MALVANTAEGLNREEGEGLYLPQEEGGVL